MINTSYAQNDEANVTEIHSEVLFYIEQAYVKQMA